MRIANTPILKAVEFKYAAFGIWLGKGKLKTRIYFKRDDYNRPYLTLSILGVGFTIYFRAKRG